MLFQFDLRTLRAIAGSLIVFLVFNTSAGQVAAYELKRDQLAQVLPQSPPIAPNQIQKPSTPSKRMVYLRSAVQKGLIKFQLTGDGVTTSHVRLSLTNTGKDYLRVLIPANEVFRPNAANIQMMMSTKDKIVSISPESTAIVDLPTVCVSVRSIKPPGKEGTSFEVGAYPDLEAWKDLAGILLAAKRLDKEGAYQQLLTKRELRQSTIAQLAIWMLLGKRTGKDADAVTPTSIGSEMLDQVGVNRSQLTPEKQARFDKGVDEIFQAADITLKRSKEFREVATLPTDSDFDSFKQVGQRAFDNGDYVEAEELLNAAVAAAVVFGEADPRYIQSLNVLGNCYFEEGRYEQAQSTLKTAINSEQKSATGPDSAEAGTTYTYLGLIGLAQKNYDGAKGDLFKGLAIREKSLGPESTPIAQTLIGIGQLNLAQDQFADAETAFRRALAIQYKNVGPKSQGVAECNKNLADAEAKQGNYGQAEKLYLKALEIATTALGAENPYLATILIGLSSTYQANHKSAEAEKLASQAAAINEKSFGNNKTLLASLPTDSGALSRAANFASEQDKIEASVKEIQSQTDPTIQALKKDSEERLHRKVRDKWALVIGISKFADPSINLKYAAKDAKDFADYLIRDAHFSPDHVRLLLDDKATRENILSQLGDKWLPRTAGPDDLVVIYISSHGSPSQADVAGVNYVVAYNTDKYSLLATGIPLRDMTSLIKERIHSDRVVLVMDACHSGAAVEEQQLASKGLFRVTNFSADEVFQGTGQMVICSSQPNQVSWESKEYPNGVFTHRLLEGLRKSGTNTMLNDACQYMKDSVQNEVLKDRGELQTPVLKSKWQGNDLVLAVPPSDPQPGMPDDGTTTPIQASVKATSKSDVVKTASKSTPVSKTTNKAKQQPGLKR